MVLPCKSFKGSSWNTANRKRGGEGMRFSLQTREIIADSIETITCAQFHDANISIPGCDKNMPGVVVSSESIKSSCLKLSYDSDGNGKAQQTLCNDLRWHHQPWIFKHTKKDNQHHNMLRYVLMFATLYTTNIKQRRTVLTISTHSGTQTTHQSRRTKF